MAERRMLAQGREAEVFVDSDTTVLKLMREPSYEPRVHAEAAALRCLAANGLAAPRVVEVVTVDGRPGLVMERMAGDSLLDILGRRPLSMLSAGRSMAVAHAAMHECVGPHELPSLTDVLRWRILNVDAPDDLRRAALVTLDALPDGDRLCHGDLHLGNMLGSWAAPAIIDWGDAARGDPMADVARTELLHRLGTPPPGAPATIRLLAPVGRSALVRQYLATYNKRRGVDPGTLERWKFVRAAARLAEPIPEERAPLLAFLRARVGRVSDG